MLGLLGPWLHMLATVWTSGSRDGAASCFAFAAACAIAWKRRLSIEPCPAARPAAAVAALGLFVFLYLVSVALAFRVGVSATAIAIVALVTYLCLGARTVRSLAVPFGLLTLSTPIPGFVKDWVTVRLLELVAATTAPVLGLFTENVARSGFVLTMPGGSVHIVSDCSGLGGVLLFVPLAVVLLYIHRPVGPLAGSVAIVLSAPLAFAASWGRVVITGILVGRRSPLAGSAVFHEILGTCLLIVAGLCLLWLCRLARRTPSPGRVES